jgi:hypothetical protein
MLELRLHCNPQKLKEILQRGGKKSPPSIFPTARDYGMMGAAIQSHPMDGNGLGMGLLLGPNIILEKGPAEDFPCQCTGGKSGAKLFCGADPGKNIVFSPLWPFLSVYLLNGTITGPALSHLLRQHWGLRSLGIKFCSKHLLMSGKS